jgi:hypothetical protein
VEFEECQRDELPSRRFCWRSFTRRWANEGDLIAFSTRMYLWRYSTQSTQPSGTSFLRVSKRSAFELRFDEHRSSLATCSGLPQNPTSSTPTPFRRCPLLFVHEAFRPKREAYSHLKLTYSVNRSRECEMETKWAPR